MPRLEKCVKCGSTAIVHGAMVVHRHETQEHSLNLRVDADPAAIVFKKSVRSIMHAEVCSGCGYTELYADDPAALMNAFVQGHARE